MKKYIESGPFGRQESSGRKAKITAEVTRMVDEKMIDELQPKLNQTSSEVGSKFKQSLTEVGAKFKLSWTKVGLKFEQRFFLRSSLQSGSIFAVTTVCEVLQNHPHHSHIKLSKCPHAFYPVMAV